jgi:SAM-dependent methyltransferase
MPKLRPDYQKFARMYDDKRSPQQLLEHYELETRLADELRSTAREQRRFAYSRVYQVLFASLPHHPAHAPKPENDAYIGFQCGILRKLIPKGGIFVDIGAGDCRLAIEMSAHCGQSIGVDVTRAVLNTSSLPSNFKFILSDGLHFDIETNTADCVYSHQLMEHIHPEDAEEQLREIVRILKPGGVYLCITPNRIAGPHDVSCYFDDRAKGFHLHEYTYSELAQKLRQAGFSKVKPVLLRPRKIIAMSLSIAIVIEKLISSADAVLGRRLRLLPKVRALLGINMLGRK